MKKQIAGSIAFLAIVFLQPTAITQEYSGCFVIDSSGNYRQLPQLCPNVNLDPNGLPIPPGEAGESQAGVLQVTIKSREGGTPVVDVIFNGSTTFEMLFDTGATGTLITTEMANALNVEVQGTTIATIADGSQVEVDVGVVKSVQVGNLTVGEIRVGIAPPGAEEGLRGRGLLGQDVYGNYEYSVKQDKIEFREHS